MTVVDVETLKVEMLMVEILMVEMLMVDWIYTSVWGILWLIVNLFLDKNQILD